MLYKFIKSLVRLGLFIFFRKIKFQNKSFLKEKGPLLLACNHANSFLDALIIGSYFKQPVHFLARGDAFKNSLAKKILTALEVIPIYRLSEGKEYLALNDITFEKCSRILTEGGIVLIFSEGLCRNEWKLRPLKKGTARIALNAWKQPIIENSFRILPVSLNYSSFTHFRKRAIIYLGEPINLNEISIKKPEGEQILELNKLLFLRLEKGLVLEENNVSTIKFLLANSVLFEKNKKGLIEDLKQKQLSLKNTFEEYFSFLIGTKKVAFKKFNRFMYLVLIPILFVPAVVGLIVHLPLYFPLKKFIQKKTEATVFYHSALFGAMIISYPLYALIISVILVIVYNNFFFLLCLLIIPFLALLFLFWLDCLEGEINYYRLPVQVRKNIHNAQ